MIEGSLFLKNKLGHLPERIKGILMIIQGKAPFRSWMNRT